MDPIITQLDHIDRRIGELLSSPIPTISGQIDFNIVFEKYKDLRRKFPECGKSTKQGRKQRDETVTESTATLDELAMCQSLEDCLQKSQRREPNQQEQDLMNDIRRHHENEQRKKKVLKGLANDAENAIDEKKRKQEALAEIARLEKKEREEQEEKKAVLKQLEEDAQKMRKEQQDQEEKKQRLAKQKEEEREKERRAIEEAAKAEMLKVQQIKSKEQSPADDSSRGDLEINELRQIEEEASELAQEMPSKYREADPGYDFSADENSLPREGKSSAGADAMKAAVQEFDEERARKAIMAMKRIANEIVEMKPPREPFYMTKDEIHDALISKEPSLRVSQKLLEKETLMKQSINDHEKFEQDLEKKTARCEKNGLEIAEQLTASNEQLKQLRDEGAQLEQRNRDLKEQVQTLTKEMSRRERVQAEAAVRRSK